MLSSRLPSAVGLRACTGVSSTQVHVRSSKPERVQRRLGAGSSPGTAEFSRVRGAGEHHGFRPPTLPEGQGGLYPGALACLQGGRRVLPDTSPRPVSAQTEGAGTSTGRYYTHLASLPGAAPAHWACGPHPTWLRLAAKTTCTHSLHRGHIYIRPLLQDWEK